MSVLTLIIGVIAPIYGECPHLLLHFDVNKTLIASDRAGEKTLEDVLNQLLSLKYEYKWESSLHEALSYDAYVRTVLLPGPESDLELKKRRKDYLIHFIDYLKEVNHPFYAEALLTYHDARERLNSSNGDVFSSFYRLLNHLDHEQISYTIILRSFGSEVFEIADEISLNSNIKISHKGYFNEGTLYVDNERVGNNPSEIYEKFKSLSHIAIHDDWAYWVKGEKKIQYGKPFIFDQNDEFFLSIFFDDNIVLDNSGDNIICPIDIKGFQPSIDDLAAKNQAFVIDTLDAIIMDDYFINLINRGKRFSHEIYEAAYFEGYVSGGEVE